MSAVQAATAPAAAAVVDTAVEPPQRKSGRVGYLLLLPGVVWLLVFFAIPTVQLVGTSLYNNTGSLDTGYSMSWSFGNYLDALGDYSGPFLRSLYYAVACTVLAVLLGYPLAYAIAFKSGRWRNLMLVAVIAPFFTSFLVRTLAWKAILSDNGVIVNVLQFVHILGPNGRLLATSVAVVTGLTYNFLPFMVLPLYASLEKIDPRLIEAGADLYASPFTAFRKITLPLSMPGLVAGTLLTFIPAAGDYINAQLLGTPRQYMIGNVIDNLFLVQLDYPIAGACSVVMSFNRPKGRNSYAFNAFTLDNWLHPCASAGMCSSVVTSIQIGFLATVGATVLGTLVAFALVRHRFRGRASTSVLIFLPMATPEVVMGSSLLALFTSAGFAGKLGFVSILIAHIMFCLSFVVVTVKARLAGLDSRYEQAAMDLYANEWQTFWRVTFPLVFPGILAAALLSFSLSFDDFIVTNFNHGNTITFPMFVWGSAQRGIPPQVNVIGTVMFVLALLLVLGGSVLQRKRPA